MPKPSTATKATVKHPSVRRHVNRKIRRFSLLIGAVGTLLTVFVYIASAYPSLRQWKEINLRTLSEINCGVAACNTSSFTTDWQSGGPDYVIDTETRYFFNTPTFPAENRGRFAPLDHSDTAFIARFGQPASYNAPDGEVWRLYSRQANVEGKKFEIIIGYAERAPWKMVHTPHSLIPIVDSKLKDEADKIAASLPNLKAALRGARNALSADGFEVVEANTEQVVDWGPWLPAFLSKDAHLPAPGSRFYLYAGDLYLVQTDTNGRLLATSLVPVGGLWWLVGSCGFAFVSTSVIARALSRRFLRSYFALTGVQVPTLDQALRSGEAQNVEFKRALSEDDTKSACAEDELLKSIAAFANTNDGVIFIGIDDAGHVRGLGLDFGQKDRLERKIRQLVRNRVKPTPPFQVTFEDVRGLLIVKITVVRGEAPAYMIGGVIYVRYGSSDVQAQPEDLRRLVTEYAF